MCIDSYEKGSIGKRRKITCICLRMHGCMRAWCMQGGGEEAGDKCVYALHICSVYLCVNSSIKVYRMSGMSVCRIYVGPGTPYWILSLIQPQSSISISWVSFLMKLGKKFLENVIKV